MATAVLAAEILELLPGPGDWTEADYFPLSEQGRQVELSDGNLEILPLPTYFHQLIVLRISMALQLFTAPAKLGYVAFAPLPVRLAPGKVREPDIVFMLAANADRIGRFWGVPDLAVEVLSDSTAQKDREVKRVEYARAGISEYWIVDPVGFTVEVYRLASAASYGVPAIYGIDASLGTPLLPGFTLSLADVFAPQ